jgi:hypothetical protein
MFMKKSLVATTLGGIVMKKAMLTAVLSCLALLLSVPANAQVIDPGESRDFPLPTSGFGSRDDPVIGESSWSFDAAAGWLEVESGIYVSVEDSGWAKATLTTPFWVSGSKPRSIGAFVTGDANWKGEILAGGAFGTLSEITVTASLWDKTTDSLVGSTTILNEDCKGAVFEACRQNVTGSANFNFNATVIRGHQYELRLTAKSEVESGVIGVDVISTFKDNFVDDGGVGWNGFRVTLEDDIVGLLEELKAGQEELKGGQEELKAGQEEVIKLLMTPEGKRPGWNKEGH